MRTILLRTVAVTAACTLAAATILLTAQPAMAAPPTPAFGPQIDAYASYDGQDICSPTAKPGVAAVKDMFNSAYGSHTWGITRACDVGGTSEHKEGRALDYSLNVTNSSQLAIANDIINWLLATDVHGNSHANARRLGVMYIIWNYNIWKAYQPAQGWQNRPCDGTPSDCHTNHIHISFGWAGALKQTSWWGQTGGDGVGIWRPSTGTFHMDDTVDGTTDTWVTYGNSGDQPLTGDWDGDGMNGVGVYRASSGTFHLDNNRDGATDLGIAYGGSTDIGVTGDWDGDNRDGVGVWRASTGTFYLDNNRDGATDVWIVYGGSADIPVTGDWDGDGLDGVGVWRASTGTFYLDNNRDGATDVWVVHGGSTDIPVTGDWDGNGSDGVGVWRASSGTFHLDQNHDGSTDTWVVYGSSSDMPVS